MARQHENLHGPRDGPPPIFHRGPGPLPPHPAILEEELELQHRDIQRILAENRHVNDENVLLQRELTAVKDEIHRLGQVIPKLRANKDAQARELIERGLKLENELRAVEPLRAEVGHLRAEAQQLNSLRQDLSTQVQTLTKDMTRLQSENQQLVPLRTDIDEMRKDLVETRYCFLLFIRQGLGRFFLVKVLLGMFAVQNFCRRVFEYEKKANEEQLEQKQAMEKNLVSIAREIEKLRAEQLSAERRARGLGKQFLSFSLSSFIFLCTSSS